MNENKLIGIEELIKEPKIKESKKKWEDKKDVEKPAYKKENTRKPD